MPNNFFSQIDSIIVYLFTTITLCHTYQRKLTGYKGLLSIILSTALYTVCFKPIDMHFSSMWLFLVSLFVFGFIYAYFFVDAPVRVTALFLISYIYSFLCIKTFSFTFVSELLFKSGINEIDTVFLIDYIFQDLALCFLSLFFVYHPLNDAILLPKRYWFVMFLSPIILASYIQSQLNSTEYSLGINDNGIFQFICFAFIMVLIIYYLSYVFLNTYKSLSESEFTAHKFQLQSEYYLKSLEVASQVREEKHELKNHYFYIQGLVRQQKYKELDSFLESEIAERLTMLDEYHTGDEFLDYLLTQKTAEARSFRIDVMTDIVLSHPLHLGEKDMCALFGNLFDNAIDACQKEKVKKIAFTIKEDKGGIYVEIRNTCTRNVLEENPNLKTIKSKAQYHGYGLKIIRQIVNKYNGNIIFENSDKEFIVKVFLLDISDDGLN